MKCGLRLGHKNSDIWGRSRLKMAFFQPAPVLLQKAPCFQIRKVAPFSEMLGDTGCDVFKQGTEDGVVSDIILRWETNPRGIFGWHGN